MISGPVQCSLLKRAQEKGLLSIHLHDIRNFSSGPHRTVDDVPYGGGAGMVMKPEPLIQAVESIPTGKKGHCPEGRRVLLSPRGKRLTQKEVERLSGYDPLILICGRYEGIDERVCQTVVDEEISIGDYVLSGGEMASLVVLEAVSRLIPGVLGNEDSLATESFQKGLLEYPHYTRPREFRGMSVPEVLMSGNHREIDIWRRRESIQRTWKQSPELLEKADLTPEEREFLKGLVENAG